MNKLKTVDFPHIFLLKKNQNQVNKFPFRSFFIDPMYRGWHLGHSTDEANIFTGVIGMVV